MLYSIKSLEKSVYFSMPVISLREHLLREDKSGIIAEIKRKSPSKGVINATSPLKDIRWICQSRSVGPLGADGQSFFWRKQ